MNVPEQNAMASSTGWNPLLSPMGWGEEKESEVEDASVGFHKVKDPETPPLPFCLSPFRGFFPFQPHHSSPHFTLFNAHLAALPRPSSKPQHPFGDWSQPCPPSLLHRHEFSQP